MTEAYVIGAGVGRIRGPIPHGTIYAYVKRRCRCSDCREANRIACAEYRRRRAYRKWALEAAAQRRDANRDLVTEPQVALTVISSAL